MELVKLEQAEKMLASIVKAKDATQVIDLAEAARVYARQVKLGVSMVNHATEIKLRAERRLAAIVDEGQAKGKIKTKQSGRPRNKSPESGDITPETLPELGVSDRRLSESRAIAKAFTDEDITAMAEEATSSGQELSRSGVLEKAKAKNKPRAADDPKWQERKRDLVLELRKRVFVLSLKDALDDLNRCVDGGVEIEQGEIAEAKQIIADISRMLNKRGHLKVVQ